MLVDYAAHFPEHEETARLMDQMTTNFGPDRQNWPEIGRGSKSVPHKKGAPWP